MNRFIPVSKPFLGKEEEENILDALKEQAISGLFGKYIKEFEEGFADYIGTKYAVTCSSGTTAIHLALASLKLKPGDEILIASLTNMATFFPALTLSLKPVPVDIDADTLNINPGQIEKLINEKTKAIIVVHLFGHPVDMDPVLAIADKYNLYVIEDCAQAHSAEYKEKRTGSIGDIGCFSFYANKIITTGEGGMITTDSEEIFRKAQSLKSLAFGNENKFMHQDIGYNFRMTNLQAAIGLAQLKKIVYIIDQKRRIANHYHLRLSSNSAIQLPCEKEYAKNVYWMYHVVLKGILKTKRNSIMKKLLEKGIETREGFIPYNMQDIILQNGLVNQNSCPVANSVAYSSFYLPSSPDLSNEQLDFICDQLLEIIRSEVN